jgi:hypothetical protein
MFVLDTNLCHFTILLAHVVDQHRFSVEGWGSTSKVAFEAHPGKFWNSNHVSAS